MGIQIAAFIKSPILRKWSNELINNLKEFVEIYQFNNVQDFQRGVKDKMSQLQSISIALLESENDLFDEYKCQILASKENIKLLACGYPKSLDEIKILFQTGIMGYVEINSSEMEVLKAINYLLNNKYYLPGNGIDRLISDYINDVDKNQNKESFSKNSIQIKNDLPEKHLNLKERVVVEYLLKGYTYKQIAELIGLTAFSVNQRTKSIYKKFGVKSRSELSYLLLNK